MLLGRRGKSSTHAQGVWGLPGGKLDFGESLPACAVRETREEAGIEVKNIEFLALTNDLFKNENKHFVTIFMIADHQAGDPQVLEKNKMEQWAWFLPDQLPKPLFSPITNLFNQGIDLSKEISKRKLSLAFVGQDA